MIASGPTVPDAPGLSPTPALVMSKDRIIEPAAVMAQILLGVKPMDAKPGDPIFALGAFSARPASCRARSAPARRRRCGETSCRIVLSDRIEGEARYADLLHAAIARQLRAGEFRIGDRAVSLLRLALRWRDHRHCQVRGSRWSVVFRWRWRARWCRRHLRARLRHRRHHGTEDNAGAILYADSVGRAADYGISAAAALAPHGYGFFAALGDLVITGPTLTKCQ